MSVHFRIFIRNTATGQELGFDDRQGIADFLATQAAPHEWEGWQNLGKLPEPSADPAVELQLQDADGAPLGEGTPVDNSSGAPSDGLQEDSTRIPVESSGNADAPSSDGQSAATQEAPAPELSTVEHATDAGTAPDAPAQPTTAADADPSGEIVS